MYILVYICVHNMYIHIYIYIYIYIHDGGALRALLAAACCLGLADAAVLRSGIYYSMMYYTIVKQY